MPNRLHISPVYTALSKVIAPGTSSFVISHSQSILSPGCMWRMPLDAPPVRVVGFGTGFFATLSKDVSAGSGSACSVPNVCEDRLLLAADRRRTP